jgi:hypothetical protein
MLRLECRTTKVEKFVSLSGWGLQCWTNRYSYRPAAIRRQPPASRNIRLIGLRVNIPFGISGRHEARTRSVDPQSVTTRDCAGRPDKSGGQAAAASLRLPCGCKNWSQFHTPQRLRCQLSNTGGERRAPTIQPLRPGKLAATLVNRHAISGPWLGCWCSRVTRMKGLIVLRRVLSVH